MARMTNSLSNPISVIDAIADWRAGPDTASQQICDEKSMVTYGKILLRSLSLGLKYQQHHLLVSRSNQGQMQQRARLQVRGQQLVSL
jgi:hypothetical protein